MSENPKAAATVDATLTPEAGVRDPEPGGALDRTREVPLGSLSRSVTLEIQGDLSRALTTDEESGATELVVPVSSEYEVRRDFTPYGYGPGVEILDHSDGAVDLSRIKDGAAVVAPGKNGGWDPHTDGILVGATRGAWLDDRRLLVRMRFASTEDAQRELTLIRDGIRRNVSIRYHLDAVERSRDPKGGPDRYTARKWTPIHVALVNDPHDPSVGFGRSDDGGTPTEITDLTVEETRSASPEEGQAMSDQNTPASAGTPPAQPATATVDRAAIRRELAEERAEITKLAKRFGHGDLADRAITEGWTLAQFKDQLLDRAPRGGALEATDDPANLDMGREDTRRYSFFRALRYLENRSNPALADEAGLEIEASRAIQDATGQEARGLFVPTDILRSSGINLARMMDNGLGARLQNAAAFHQLMGRAELGATQTDQGQKLVQTDVLGASFIDILRNTSAILPRATVLSGLQGNVEIPRKTVATAGTWVATEGADTAADDVTIGNVTMSAKDIGAHVIIRRRLLLQSSVDVEDMIRTDLAMAIALGLDSAAIAGDGLSGAPTGFLNNGSIGDVTLAAPAAPTWAEVLDLWKLVAQGNALFGDLVWLMGANHAAYFLGTEKFASSGRAIMEDLQRGPLGYALAMSEQCPADTVAFLNARQVVVGLWGGVDILVDPYSASKSASIVVRAIQTADTNLRQEAAVAAWQNSTVS